MVRILLIASVFLTITISLLMIRPTSKSDRFVDTNSELASVTQLETEITEIPKLTPPAEAPQSLVLSAPAAAPQQDTSTPTVTEIAQPTPAQTNIPGLEELVKVALEQKMSGAEISLWLNQAADSGVITVPDAYRDPNGRVDALALLATLTPKGSSVIDQAKTGRPYVIRQGDTLASIALSNYGDMAVADDIFWANRTKLQSPEDLRVGSTLYLPAL